MTRKQLEKFAKKVNYNTSIEINFFYHKNKECGYFKDYKVYINTWGLKKEETIIKSSTMHEIGHMHTEGYCTKNNDTEREILAHSWAIERAIELNLHRIKKDLLKDVVFWREINKFHIGNYMVYRRAAKELIKYYKIC